MKILFICPSFNIGGFSSHALNLGRALRAQGHDAAALIVEPLGGLEGAFREVFAEMRVARRGVETRAGYARRLAQLVNESAPDAAVNSGVAFMQAAWPLVAPGIRRVAVIHSIGENEVRVACANQQSVDAIVAVADNVRATAAPLAGETRLETIPVGIPLPVGDPPPRSPAPPVRLAWVGRLTNGSKNLAGLAAIMDELHRRGVSFALRVIGDGPDRPLLERRATAAPWAAAATFAGAVLPGRVPKLLSEAHVFLLPSAFEGTPHALLEAMAVGCVPVASRIPGSTDRIITDGATGRLCPSADPTAFAVAIAELAGNPAGLARMSAAATAAMREHYAIEIIAERYLGLFADLGTGANDRPAQQTAPAFPPELSVNCHALPRHLRRRLGDLLRRLAGRYSC
jgi:glycosyltransferase involved in cell wall biosynthesis